MSSPGFRVVFKGEVLDGFTIDSVKQKFISQFRVPEIQLDALFSGKPIVVKKYEDETSARKLTQMIQRSGARCYLQRITNKVQDAPQPPAVPQPQPAKTPIAPVVPLNVVEAIPAPVIDCPKCGHHQSKGDECINCGVVFKKFAERGKPVSGNEPTEAATEDIHEEAVEQDELLKRAKKLFNMGMHKMAFDELEPEMYKYSDNCRAHYLLSRIYNDGPKFKDKAKNMALARNAAELAGPDNEKVQRHLFDILKKAGETEESKKVAAVILKIIEKKIQQKEKTSLRTKLEQQYDELIEKALLPVEWHFYTIDEKFLVKEKDVINIRSKLLDGTIPYDALCRRNGIGQLKPVKKQLAKKERSISLAYKPLGYFTYPLSAIAAFAGMIYFLPVYTEWTLDCFMRCVEWYFMTFTGNFILIILFFAPYFKGTLVATAIVFCVPAAILAILGIVVGVVAGTIIGAPFYFFLPRVRKSKSKVMTE